MTENEKLLIDRKTAAGLLSLGLRSLDTLLASGTLPSIRVGRRRLIKRRDLQRFAERSHPNVDRKNPKG